MKPFFLQLPDGKLQCTLCPHSCVIPEGGWGRCQVRRAHQGKIDNPLGAKISARHLDPVEKKPLYHYFPGQKLLSIGGVGCNFHCAWCQNYTISSNIPTGFALLPDSTPDSITRAALAEKQCIGVAFTYNEPIINLEFVIRTAEKVRAAGLKTVIVTNGYVNSEPLHELLAVTDAFNVDLKGFNESLHKQSTGGSVEVVKQTITTIAESGRHLEITFLAIPGINVQYNTFDAMCKWACTLSGGMIPLHINRYHPAWRCTAAETPLTMLQELCTIARRYLHHVYQGNTSRSEGTTTYCHSCGETLIERSGFYIEANPLKGGCCPGCGQPLYGCFG